MTEFGLFAVDTDARRVRGYLVPWDELSRTSISDTPPVKFRPDTLRLPRTPSVAKLNKDHKQVYPMGTASLFAVHDKGLYAEFTIDDSDDGDAWLADHGDHVRLSAEVRDLQIDGEYATATLTGAALVPMGAFQSAALFAIDQPHPETTDDESDTPEDAPAAEDTETDPESEEEKEDAVAEFATVPGALTTTRAEEKKPTLTRAGLFQMIEKVQSGRATPEERRIVMEAMPGQSAAFALSDIDYNGAAGVGSVMTPTNWIGEVLDGTSYTQKYAPLFGSKTLGGLAMAGWRWVTKPAGDTWTGNKDAIPSNTADVEAVSENATRWAGGHDIAREHRDFGTPGFFEAYNAAMRESFDRWLDETIVLTEALAGATDIEADNPSGLDIGEGWSALIDGATEIVDAGLIPTGAIVESSLWKAMAKVPNADTLGYLGASLGLTGGELDGFRIVPSSDLTTRHVLVVSRDAADVYTLPGSPIRAEALNIGNGGIDVGFFGYGGFLIKNAAGIVDVAPYTP